MKLWLQAGIILSFCSQNAPLASPVASPTGAPFVASPVGAPVGAPSVASPIGAPIGAPFGAPIGAPFGAPFAESALYGLKDQDLSQRQSQGFQFTWSNSTLLGTIWLPHNDTASNTLVALVHGDGPQDRTSGGGYNPLINTLLDRGIAVVAWDKAGVGESKGGSWLDQSMSDRADETRAAIQKLREQFSGFSVGAIGFSQAGWVLPRLSREDGLDYLVLVGPAVNWQDQGDYYGTKRMELEGLTPAAIQEALAKNRASDEVIFNAPTYPQGAINMTEERWAFVKRNRNADATPFLSNLDIPTLAVWGKEDLNVDAIHDAKIYQELLEGDQHQVVLIPNATHGLLKAIYNYQLSSQWPLDLVDQWYLEGRLAYAEGYLELITDWVLKDHSKGTQDSTSFARRGTAASVAVCSFYVILTGMLLVW